MSEFYHYYHQLCNFNLLRLIDNENPKKDISRSLEWTAYYRLDDIYTFLDEMHANHQFTDVTTIGTTHEGRPIKMFSITRGPVSQF